MLSLELASIPTVFMIAINGKKFIESSVKLLIMSGIPYAPNFESTPAITTEPDVGASEYAFGIQEWNGNTGIFMANVMNMSIDVHSNRFA